jgi:hypothetical protein
MGYKSAYPLSNKSRVGMCKMTYAALKNSLMLAAFAKTPECPIGHKRGAGY